MAANGRVITGFSQPYVAVYSESGGVVSYASGQILARGVSVDLSIDAADDNNFYADNVVAESATGQFGGGTVTLTVDGLFTAAEKLILGLPTADGDGWTAYGDAASIPYIGLGFIVRYMSDGVTTYVPVILTKVKFSMPNLSANTQEDGIDWQTQELTATIMRDDTSDHNWKYVGAGQATEAAAATMISTKLA